MSVIYMLKLEEEPDQYDTQFNKLTQNIASEVRTWISTRIPANSRVLDLGCGPGTFIAQLAQEKKCKATGVDINQTMIQYAQSNIPDTFNSEASTQLNYIQSSITQLSAKLPEDFTFDSIVSMFLLTELRPLEQQIMLREIWKRLAPKGKVFLAAEFLPKGFWRIPFEIRRSRYLKKLGRKKRGLPHPTANFSHYIEPIGFSILENPQWQHGGIQIFVLQKKENSQTRPGFYTPTSPTTQGWKGWWNKARCILTGQVDNIAIEPGIYRSGHPTEKSPVLITANYLYTYTQVMQDLKGKNAHIGVVDSRGINVWCAARGGEFGNNQLEELVQATNVRTLATTKQMILPQLAAGGVKAPELPMGSTAFPYEIAYGPVESKDLPEYLKQTPDYKPKSMRMVPFQLPNRMLAGVTHIAFLFRKLFALPIIALFVLGIILLALGVPTYLHLLWEPSLLIVVSNLFIMIAFPITRFTRSFVQKSIVFGLIDALFIGILTFAIHYSWIYGILSMGIGFWLGFFSTMSFSGYTPLTSVREIQAEYQLYRKLYRIFQVVGILLYVLANIFWVVL